MAARITSPTTGSAARSNDNDNAFSAPTPCLVGSGSRGQWNGMIGSVHSNPGKEECNMNISSDQFSIPTRVGSSGPRNQWTMSTDADAAQQQHQTDVVGRGRTLSQASHELDTALSLSECSSSMLMSDDNNDMNDIMSVNTTTSETTARTGNISSSSPMRGGQTTHNRQVTPDNSPEGTTGKKTHGNRKSILSSQDHQKDDNDDDNELVSLDELRSKRLVMCGASLEVKDEWKESIQDVNDTLRQIMSTVRHFGADEKDAVRDTIKDASYFIGSKVRSALLPNNSACGREEDQSSSVSVMEEEDANDNGDDEDNMMEGATSPSRGRVARRGRDANERRLRLDGYLSSSRNIVSQLDGIDSSGEPMNESGEDNMIREDEIAAAASIEPTTVTRRLV